MINTLRNFLYFVIHGTNLNKKNFKKYQNAKYLSKHIFKKDFELVFLDQNIGYQIYGKKKGSQCERHYS